MATDEAPVRHSPAESTPQHGGKEPAFSNPPPPHAASENEELRKELQAERRRAAELEQRLLEMSIADSGRLPRAPRKSVTLPGESPTRSPTLQEKKSDFDSDSAPAREQSDPTSATHSLTAASASRVAEAMLTALPALPAFGTDGFVNQMLAGTEQLLGAEDVVPAVTAWLERRKRRQRSTTAANQQRTQEFKFGDGIDSVRSFGMMRKVALYAKEYVPPTDVWGMVEGLARWCTPKGLVWPARAIEDLTRNCRLAASRHVSSSPANDACLVPLYVYTSALYNRPLWAVWVPGLSSWKEIARGHLVEAAREAAQAQGRESFKLERELLADVSSLLDCHQDDLSSNVHPMPALPHGVSAYHCSLRQRRGSVAPRKNREESTAEPSLDRRESARDIGNGSAHITFVRYVAGRGELSPLADSVAWLPPHADAFGQGMWALDQSRLPPSGVIEYIESRRHTEVWEGAGWSVRPLGSAAHDALIAQCYAEPNQNRYNAVLHTKLTAVLDSSPPHGVSAPRRKAMDAKLEHDEGRPVPQSIAHALELQHLRYGGRDCIIALSGFPRVIVDNASLAIVSVQRVYHEHDEQPYLLLNGTMRAVQEGAKEAWLDVLPSAGSAVAGKYLARLPAGSELRHTTDPHKTVKWDPFLRSWICGIQTRVAAGDTKLHLGTWMLDDLRPMMYFLDRALAEIPPEDTVVKSYRGLADAMLPHDMYHTGALVVWGSFSSSSADQATATWFATQGGAAAVFTLRGRSCRMIAPWSRFSREMEWLYPAGCTFQVKTMLTEDQQQILGREELQLYEVDEVDEVDALTIFVTAHINAAITRDEGFAKVNQLVGIIQPLLCKDLKLALQQAVQPDRPFILDAEGVEMSLRLCELAKSADPPVDCDDILNRALISAARDGHTSAIPNLIDIGASLNATDESDLSVLEVAIRSGHVDTARCLLSLGASRRVLDELGPGRTTALHRMAAAGEQHAVSVLIALGADPTARDFQGRTPAVCAYERGHKAVVRLLNPEETLPTEVLEDFWATTQWRSDHGEARYRFGDGAAEARPFSMLTQKAHFWPADYSPPGVWDMVCDVDKWSTPIGVVYSEKAVEELVANCRLMDAKHSQGMPPEVVVPLYVHTSTLYHNEIWMVWEARCGKRVSHGGWRPLTRRSSQPLVSLFAVAAAGAAAAAPDAMAVSPQLLIGSEDTSQACPRCGRTAIETLSTLGSVCINSPTLAASHATLHHFQPPGSGMLWDCSPSDAGGCRNAEVWHSLTRLRMPQLTVARNIAAYGWAGGQSILRYAAQPDDSPLRGATAWLPPPDVLFGDGPMRAGSLPSSSVLEYIYSRPADAYLDQRTRKGGTTSTAWRCSTALSSPDAQALLDACSEQRNQYQYDQALHDRFNMLLPSLASREEDRSVHELLQMAAEAKLRGRRRPTPEVLAHALALQRFEEKGGRKWVLGFSGEPRLMMHEESMECARMSRVCSPLLPSPSEHADGAVRALRRGQTVASLDVTPCVPAHAAFAGHYVDPFVWRDINDPMIDPRDELGLSVSRNSSRIPRGDVPATPHAAPAAGVPASPGDASPVHATWVRAQSTHSMQALPSPRANVRRTLRSPTTSAQQSMAGFVFRRTVAPHHAARWDAAEECWAIQPDFAGRFGFSYAARPGKRVAPTLLSPDECHFELGTWLLPQVQPLLYYVYTALEALPRPAAPRMCFRAAGAVPRDVLAVKSVLFWDSISVATLSRSVAMAHLTGDERAVSVFRMMTRNSCVIAPWSRLSRECECMVPAQATLQVIDVVEEQRAGVVVFDLAEIDDAAALVLFIREVIKKPPPGEAAPAYVTQLFKVIAAVEAGSLDQALALAVRPDRPVLLSDYGTEVAERCIALGADITVVSVALREAAREGLPGSVNKLLQIGGDPDFAVDPGGDTPLELAVLGGHVETVQALVQNTDELIRGTDPSEPPLHRRAARGQPLAVYTLLQLGADVKMLDSLGRTAAHCAHAAERTFCVYVLMYGSGNPLPPDLAPLYTESLPVVLRTAVEAAAADAVLAFMQIGADPIAAPDQHGHTALHHAARVAAFNSGQGLSAFRQLAVGVPNAHAAVDSARQTPLHEAAEHGHAAVAMVLLQAGADPHALDIVGNTPLALAQGDEVAHVLRRAMDQAMAEAARRIQQLPGEVALALQRLTDTLADPSTGGVSANEAAIVGFGGALRAVRNLLLRQNTRDQRQRMPRRAGTLTGDMSPRADTMSAPRFSIQNVSTDTVISAEDFRLRFVGWGPPEESDAMLLDRIHSWLGNLGALDGQNAMRWVQQREQHARSGIEQDEADVRRSIAAKHTKQLRERQRRKEKAHDTHTRGAAFIAGVFLTEEQKVEEWCTEFKRPFRALWAVVYLFAFAHACIEIPIRFSYETEPIQPLLVIETIVYVVAVLVVVLTYDWPGALFPKDPLDDDIKVRMTTSTAYVSQEASQGAKWKRKLRALLFSAPVTRKSCLWLSQALVAAVPLHDCCTSCSDPLRATLRLNRLLGLANVPRMSELIQSQWLAEMNPAVLRALLTALCLAYTLHALVCLAPHVQTHDACVEAAWEIHHHNYWACTLAVISATSGWGSKWYYDLDDFQVVVHLLLAFVGLFLLALYLGLISNVVERWNLRKKEYDDAMHSIQAWLSHAGADAGVRRDVERYFRLLWRTERGLRPRSFDPIVQEVSVHLPRLARELRYALDQNVLREVPFFASFDTDVKFMHEVVQSLQLHLGVPGSVLCEEGSAATCMFFIASGVVEIYVDGFLAQGQYHDGRRVATLTAGDYFGEVALLQDTARSASAVSLTDTRMYVLERGDAFDRIRKYPAAFAALIDAMSKRKRSLEMLKPRPRPGLTMVRPVMRGISTGSAPGEDPPRPTSSGLGLDASHIGSTSPTVIVSESIPSLATSTLELSAAGRSVNAPASGNALSAGGARSRSRSALEGAHLRQLEQILRTTAERGLHDSFSSDEKSEQVALTPCGSERISPTTTQSVRLGSPPSPSAAQHMPQSAHKAAASNPLFPRGSHGSGGRAHPPDEGLRIAVATGWPSLPQLPDHPPDGLPPVQSSTSPMASPSDAQSAEGTKLPDFSFLPDRTESIKSCGLSSRSTGGGTWAVRADGSAQGGSAATMGTGAVQPPRQSASPAPDDSMPVIALTGNDKPTVPRATGSPVWLDTAEVQ
eukprot:TRINITY_DN6247_c1_g2_i4.p1 TRINITY_DN6247_c1_g2~~TRINITY_DN6247_c1_g2_i4.p1  ORF type:complete len:3168 (+),score=793.88 TRINITY_DN6247_c1_g2_i4:75-9578(+)